MDDLFPGKMDFARAKTRVENIACVRMDDLFVEKMDFKRVN